MSDAYADSGVDTNAADRAVAALVGVLRTIETGRPSRSVVPSGHYASVLRVSDDLGIAIATDGVGSKLVVAEETGRLDKELVRIALSYEGDLDRQLRMLVSVAEPLLATQLIFALVVTRGP